MKLAKPRWTDYEQQVFELFKQHFPTAKLRRNVHLRGRYSKRKRQIDILIIERTPSGILKTVVDTKLFKRKVDVRTVDGLAGFVDDVGAQRGMLITNRGFTKAALRRAFYGPSDLELDILDFSALQRFQGFGAIPYAGEHAFLVPAPFGWIIDAARRTGWIASMYQRGLDLESAVKKMEFLYINFWNRGADRITAAELDERQVAAMKVSGTVTVSHRTTIQRSDALTRLRIAEVQRYNCLEVTGFLEFDDVIFFAVLLTSRETQSFNIRRLESVLRQAIPIKLNHDSTPLIKKIREQLNRTLPDIERARLLSELGHWYRVMGQIQEARQSLEESLSRDPQNSYETIRELLLVLAKFGDRSRGKEVMALLLRLDPRNATVFSDCITFAAGWLEVSEMLTLNDNLKTELPDDHLVKANCDYYAGSLLIYQDPASAKKRFIAARKTFHRVFSREHHVFKSLRINLKQCPQSI